MNNTNLNSSVPAQKIREVVQFRDTYCGISKKIINKSNARIKRKVMREDFIKKNEIIIIF